MDAMRETERLQEKWEGSRMGGSYSDFRYDCTSVSAKGLWTWETLQKRRSGQSHAHLICTAKEKSIETCGRRGVQGGSGRKDRALFYESHLKPVFHHWVLDGNIRQLRRNTKNRCRSEGKLLELRPLSSTGCKQGSVQLIEQNVPICFVTTGWIWWVEEGGKEAAQSRRVGKRKKRSLVC